MTDGEKYTTTDAADKSSKMTNEDRRSSSRFVCLHHKEGRYWGAATLGNQIGRGQTGGRRGDSRGGFLKDVFECGWKGACGEGRAEHVSDRQGDGGSCCL